MPISTIDDLFHFITINRIVSRIQGPTHRLMQFYGLGPGGPNVDDVGGEKFGWDLFDRTRRIVAGRARAAPPGQTHPQPVGNVTATCYRMFETVPIDYDRIYRRRGIGQPYGTFDVMGQRYLTRQIGHQAERFMNAREILIMWMFRGGFELNVVGDEVRPVPLGSGGEISVNFQHPARNQDTVDGIFAGNWQTRDANAKLVDELLALNRDSARNSRYPIQVGWINSKAAGHILANPVVQATGGTANIVFQDGAGALRFETTNDEGQLSNILTFVLRGYPLIRWMVYDDQILLRDGTPEPFIKDGFALFTPAPSSNWLEWKNGSEPTKKSVDGPIEDTYGFTAWQETQRNPVSIALYMLDNGLPAPYVPSAWYWAKIHS